MLKQLKIILLVFGLVCTGYGQATVTTGDLIIAPKDSTNWPPLILVRPELTFTFDTDFFKIHYDTAGVYAVYQSGVDIDPPDGIPDYVNRIADFLELSRSVYIDSLDYDPPPPDEGSGGDNFYDIYVTNITGLTVPEFLSTHYPGRQAYASYILIGNDLRCENHPDDPIPLMKATCSHEFFHAVQMAYRAYTQDETPWWYELTANWAEERVFDDLNEIYFNLPDYYLDIDRSIYLTAGSHMYGAWVFAEYLSQRHEVNIINLIFRRLINLDNSLIAIITALAESGINFDEEFSTFAAWNYFTGVNYKPGFFEEGSSFPVTVPLSGNHQVFPTGWRDAPWAIENLGIAYINFINPGINKGDLVIEFESDENYSDEVSVIAIYNDRPIEITIYSLGSSQIGILRVNEFDKCENVVIAINWPYPGYDISDTATYHYNAYIDSTSIAIQTSHTSQPGKFKLVGNYPNPFNLQSNIIFYWNFEPTDYKIEIFNTGGQLVDLIRGDVKVGLNDVKWIPEDYIPSGVYYYSLKAAEKQIKAKMMLLK